MLDIILDNGIFGIAAYVFYLYRTNPEELTALVQWIFSLYTVHTYHSDNYHFLKHLF